jgi:hypothetical protein
VRPCMNSTEKLLMGLRGLHNAPGVDYAKYVMWNLTDVCVQSDKCILSGRLPWSFVDQCHGRHFNIYTLSIIY